MTKMLHQITIKDFRSFEDGWIDFEDVTCVVGPNESGKTNLLDAVNMILLAPEKDTTDKRYMQQSDTRKNSESFKFNRPPQIEFKIAAHLIKDERLHKHLKVESSSLLTLIRKGNTNFIGEKPSVVEDRSILNNLTEEKLEIKNEKKASTLSIPSMDWLMITKEEEKEITDKIANLVSEKKMELYEMEEELESFLAERCLEEVNENLKVFFWGFDRKKYGLPDIVNISEFLEKPEDRLAVLSVFRLAGYEDNAIPRIFEEKTETDFENIFNGISDSVTQQIRKAWPPNPNIELRLSYKKDHLLINVKEPGYSIEPQYRSEGLQWFLAFLIGMLAQEKDLKDHIVLVDEPGLQLHPGGQKAVLSKINELSQNNQVIYTTHSPFMVDKRFAKRVRFLLKNTASGYSLTKVQKPTKDQILRDPLLRVALGYTVTDLSYLGDLNLLVEGYFDKKVMELLVDYYLKNSKIEETLDLNNMGLINCSGAGEIAKHATLYKNAGLACLSLYDSDQAGSSAKDANLRKNVQAKEEIISIAQIGSDFETIEDLLPEKVFKDSVLKYFADEIKTEKVNYAVPRTKTMDSLIAQRIKEKHSGLEQRGLKNQIKREFEGYMLEELELCLNTMKLEENSPLARLHSTIRELTAKTQQYP